MQSFSVTAVQKITVRWRLPCVLQTSEKTTLYVEYFCVNEWLVLFISLPFCECVFSYRRNIWNTCLLIRILHLYLLRSMLQMGLLMEIMWGIKGKCSDFHIICALEVFSPFLYLQLHVFMFSCAVIILWFLNHVIIVFFLCL